MAEAEEVGDVSASVEDDHAASMDLDSTSSKRRHDGATSVLQEQRLPEREWRVAGKKPRVTRAQRSSSLPRDDTKKSKYCFISTTRDVSLYVKVSTILFAWLQ